MNENITPSGEVERSFGWNPAIKHACMGARTIKLAGGKANLFDLAENTAQTGDRMFYWNDPEREEVVAKEYQGIKGGTMLVIVKGLYNYQQSLEVAHPDTWGGDVRCLFEPEWRKWSDIGWAKGISMRVYGMNPSLILDTSMGRDLGQSPDNVPPHMKPLLRGFGLAACVSINQLLNDGPTTN